MIKFAKVIYIECVIIVSNTTCLSNLHQYLSSISESSKVHSERNASEVVLPPRFYSILLTSDRDKLVTRRDVIASYRGVHL